ncbi:MAG TPA: NAD-dependent epimerase/dehydratase family protein [Gammaproteobacteria bacterium]|nr:NAD-dependent epimerase/dehydratase family protein [Gammaproteobacteria bacterium]
MKNSADVIKADLEYICDHLSSEFPDLSGKRLLITGGAGFLGHYLVQAALHWNRKNSDAAPISLTVYDNFMRGIPDWLKALEEDANLVVSKYDVIDPLPEDLGDVDYIIHAATIASPIYYRLYPIETMDANVCGLRHLLDYCLQQKEKSKPVTGFLFYSTSEIYGDPTPENIPTPETYRGNVSCTGPRACYDESKRYGETLCVNFSHQHELPIRIARPFNNYGPGLKISDRRALPDFARNVLNGDDIVLLSDGAPTRTFCYVADAIVGYYKILIRGQNGESYNIGLDKPEISIKELAERVIATASELFGYEGKLVFKLSEDKHYLTDNPNRRCPVTDKAREHLDYSPGIYLEEGLKRSLLWYSDNREAEDA